LQLGLRLVHGPLAAGLVAQQLDGPRIGHFGRLDLHLGGFDLPLGLDLRSRQRRLGLGQVYAFGGRQHGPLWRQEGSEREDGLTLFDLVPRTMLLAAVGNRKRASDRRGNDDRLSRRDDHVASQGALPGDALALNGDYRHA
jgi:hypothetical protein